MKERTLNIIVVGTCLLLLLAVWFAGCRALHRNPMLWLCLAVGVRL